MQPTYDPVHWTPNWPTLDTSLEHVVCKTVMGDESYDADTWTPEKALMLAVLRLAIKERDTAWADSGDDEHVFSFLGICDTLGIKHTEARRLFDD